MPTNNGRNVKDKPQRLVALRSSAVNTSNKAAASTLAAKPITEKQRAFIKLWAQGESILSASERAGYSDNGTYAYRLVRQPHVIALYEAEKRKYEEACDMSRKKVMDMLIESYEMARLLAEPATMVSAAREIGKMCGYYAPVEIKTSTPEGEALKQRIDRMSDDELIKLVMQNARADTYSPA